jgi:hypothetical protein
MNLSFLMGASAISDEDLRTLGIEIIEPIKDDIRGLRIPDKSLKLYKKLLKEKLQPGYWNEIVGKTQILFIFKLTDGTVHELIYSPETKNEIAKLCSQLNNDPIEKTSDLLKYIASNKFYRKAMIKWYDVNME